MAKIGLKRPCFKGVTNGTIGKAISAEISIEVNDVKLYADDGVAESDKSFKSGKITLGVDDLSDVIQTEFLGHTVATGELTAKGSDLNPYVGIGFYASKLSGGVRKYRALFFPKVQFSEPADSNKTKGENVEFTTEVLEGTIMLDDDGVWKFEQTFDTEAAAIAWLDEKISLI